MIDGKNFFDQPVRMVLEYLKIFGKFQHAKEMIIQQVVSWTIIISKNNFLI